jgi:hydrogenase maturation protease
MKTQSKIEKHPNRKNVLIVGLGNPLMKDDGVGNFVATQLLKLSLSTHVEVTDCGTDILKITTFFNQTDEVILIDAVDAGESPGSIFYLKKHDLLKLPGKTQTVHFLSLIESLKLLDKLNTDFQKMKVTLIGIQPQSVEHQQGLSTPVKKSALTIIKELYSQYRRN